MASDPYAQASTPPGDQLPSAAEPGTPLSSEPGTPPSEPGTPPSAPSTPPTPFTATANYLQRAQELWQRNNADPDRTLLPFEGLWQRLSSSLLPLEQLPLCTCVPPWYDTPVTDPKLQLCLSCLGFRLVSAGSAVNPLLLLPLT